MTTLYDELGGDKAVDAAVDIFYRKVLSDPTTSRFFDSVDMERQAAKQKAFLTVAFGGPDHYTGQDLREAHKHMNLTEEHFQVVAEHLTSTLKELDVPERLIDQVLSIVASTHDDVLNL